MWTHLFLALLLFTYVGALKGNVCSRTVAKYRKVRRCAYRTWQGCRYYRYYWVPEYTTIYFCCQGWRHSGDYNCNERVPGSWSVNHRRWNSASAFSVFIVLILAIKNIHGRCESI
ncbi:uncharacterized protein LOC124268452 [Haliotis rubra]|uniref:uncharacterized protein LOC124268452 n=1 Tax=Haliotis rubra TaxID=36100 RepID=UPI001EE5AB8E|nr:uncharacterized protein LOC124268452 [Haliotis rubra]